ncbi:MAG: hypothetical protein U1A72_22040 [Sulfuritalea sp.]|nr:hypothetical protein [Sulfuritalea sp.]
MIANHCTQIITAAPSRQRQLSSVIILSRISGGRFGLLLKDGRFAHATCLDDSQASGF